MDEITSTTVLASQLARLQMLCFDAVTALSAFDIIRVDSEKRFLVKNRLEELCWEIYQVLSDRVSEVCRKEGEHPSDVPLPLSNITLNAIANASNANDEYFNAPSIIFRTVQVALMEMEKLEDYPPPRILDNQGFSIALGQTVVFDRIERSMIGQIQKAIELTTNHPKLLSPEQFNANDSFTEIRWCKKDSSIELLSFNTKQSSIIRRLSENTDELGVEDQDLLELIDSNATNLKDVFKKNPAWQSFILQTSRNPSRRKLAATLRNLS